MEPASPERAPSLKGEDTKVNKLLKTGAAIATMSVMAEPVMAEDNDWDFSVAVYGWLIDTGIEVGTPSGTVSAELSFKDALENLDMVFMGTFEAWNGPWGVILDYNYMNLTFNSAGPVGFSSATVGTKMSLMNSYLGYRILEEQNMSVDLAGGFRWFSLDNDVTLNPAAGPAVVESVGDDWVDPVVGARVAYRFSDKWSGILFADYGGFSSDSESWQLLATVGYDINDRWSLQGGYRYLELNREINGLDTSIDLSGLILGARYKF